MIQKKSPPLDFVRRTFVKCTYCLAACAEMDNQLAAHYRQDSLSCPKQISDPHLFSFPCILPKMFLVCQDGSKELRQFTI